MNPRVCKLVEVLNNCSPHALDCEVDVGAVGILVVTFFRDGKHDVARGLAAAPVRTKVRHPGLGTTLGEDTLHLSGKVSGPTKKYTVH